ncbi:MULTISPECIES: Xaa-Pro peptidase family protein [Anaerolinea]|uniref:M24 family metallopeptidase n=1 Tax=Anaerolinea TaxID=233189 RepID=UPI00262ABD2F|nr:M24 family metallopeptidase [Anaerolinea thermophila]
MKNDLHRLMAEHELDAIWVVGPAMHNPPMVYLTGGGHITQGDLILKRGEKGVLFHGPMERDEAARTGLITRSYSNYPFAELLKEANQNRFRASVLRLKRMLEDLNLTQGRIMLYGQYDAGVAFALFDALQKELPGLTVLGDVENQVLQQAMLTKDREEVDRIRRVGEKTVEVIANTADFLTSQKVRGDVLVDSEGKPVTVGRVKRLINLWLAERDLENPEGTIFAIGRDAGVPHSSGNAQDVIKTGQTIVFDIFPCEAGGGYFFDITRTWCIGHAPEAVEKVYEQVLSVFHTVSAEVRIHGHFRDLQRRTCELFEAMGHPTVLTQPQTEVGYVHSLGHGVGLNIHEKPLSGLMAAPEDDVLLPGSVITIEPGLYYPEQGMGVRLENTLYLSQDGTVETLANYPLDLVLELKG